MTTDYDAPRTRESDPTTDGGVRLDTRRSDAAAATLTVDDDVNGYTSSADLLERLTGDELTVTVVAQRSDEFTCARCFLIHHRSRHAPTAGNGSLCRDCA